MSLRVNFINKVVKLNSSIKFQYWFNNYPCKSWFTYDEMLQRHSQIFYINNQILRAGIVTKHYEELRIDIDTKDNGEKSLSKCIETFNFISTIFNRNNIKYSLYYSAGAGLHIHLLYFNREFKTLENSKKVRELICEKLGFIHLIDTQLLSNNQMMTCEGYQKRKTKTNEFKIYIGEEERENIREFIEKNKSKSDLINFNFFNEVNEFNSEIVEFVKREYETRYSNTKDNLKQSDDDYKVAIYYNNKEKKKFDEIKIIKYLVTFCKLYNEKAKNSSNQVYTMIITYLYSETLDEELTLKYFKMCFDTFKINNNLSCSIEQKVQVVCENFRAGRTKIFFSNEYFTKEEFFKELYSLFPNKVHSVAYASNSNEQSRKYGVNI